MLTLSGWEIFVVYIPTILFFVIFLWQLIAGLRRGLRKSTILFINMMIAMGVTLIIFFIFFGSKFDENLVKYYNVIANWFNLGSLGSVLGTGVEHARLSDYILDLIVKNIDSTKYVISDTASLSATIQLVIVLAESITRYVVFFVMSIVYYLMKFLLYIIYLIFFKEKRYKKKIAQNFCLGISTKEYKPKHLWGMAVGAFRGLVVGIFIFSFIGGAFHMLTNGEYSKDDLIEEDVIVADSFRINSVIEMVNRYGKTGIGQVLESIGTKKNGPWYLLIADGIISVDYKVTIDGEEVGGTLVPRKELGPIMGLVKDSYILFKDYNVDLNRLNDPTYLSEALNSEINGITLADQLDKMIESHNFGNYTINLCQSFLNAVMANLPENTDDANGDGSQDMAAKLLNCIFKGEHAVKASSLVTNESISNALNLAITVLVNYQDINNFASEFKNSEQQTETLVFGLKPLNEETKKTYKGVSDTLVAIGDYIGKLDCIKDGLISDIVIILLDTLKMDGVDKTDSFKNQEYINSCEQVKWKNNLHDICNTLADFVNHITEYNLYDTNALLNDIIDNLDNENSDSRKIIDEILDADFSGVILNNPNLINIMSQTINNSTQGLISLGSNIKLGTYYDVNNDKHEGDLTNIIKNFISETKIIYNIVKENKDQPKKIVSDIFENESVTSKLSNIVDSKSTIYSPTLHSIISSALMNLNIVMPENSGIRIVIEEEYVDDNQINSEALTEALSTIIKYIPKFLADDFNYKTDVTTTMLNDLVGIKLLRASISEVIYYALSQVEEINNYIPNTFLLGDGNDNNLKKWTEKNGEIDILLQIINAGEKEDEQSKSLLQLLLNYSDETDIVKEFLAYDLETLDTIETALLDSNVLNCIIVGFIEDISINETKIKLPNLCMSSVGNKKKIKSDLNIFTILKETNLYDVIKSDDVTNNVINFMFDTDKIDIIFSNRIINSIMTQSLLSLNKDEVRIIVPITSYTEEAIKVNDKIIKTTEITGAIKILKTLFMRDEDGKYNINKIDYNKIFDIYLNETDIIGATVAGIVRLKVKDPVKIPTNLVTVDLEQNYVSSGWKEEIVDVIDGLKALKITFNNDGNVSFKANDVIKNLNKIAEGYDKTNLERMYASDTLKLTMYNTIIKSDDAVKMPLDAIDILLNVEDDKYIKLNEIEALVNTVNALGIEDIENFDVKGIFKDQTKFEALNKAMSDSTILRYTTTSYLLKNEEHIFVPDCAYDTNTISKMISTAEAQALVNVIEICGDLDTFNYNEIFKKEADDIISIVNNSSIIRSTLTNNLKKNDNIGIPKSAYDLEAAQVAKELKASARNEMLTKDEFEGLILVIKNIGLNSTDDFNFDNIFKLNKEEVFINLNKSTVLRYTIGAKLNESDNLIVPKAAYDDTIIVDDCFLDSNSTDYLYKKVLLETEIEALFDVIEKCNGTTEGFDFNTLLNDLSFDFASKVNSSYILRRTVTEKMPENINVPDEACEKIYEERYIKTNEITALFDATSLLNLSNTKDFNFDSFLNIANIDETINKSLILRCTVTDTICHVDKLTVTKLVMDAEYKSLIITKEELTSLVSAINTLGITSLESTDVSIEKISTNLNVILESGILTATISDNMYTKNCKLDLDYNDSTYLWNDANNVNNYYVMQNTYIKEYIDTIIEVLGEDASYGATINLNTYDSQTISKIKTMAKSRIILLTNSQDIIDYVNNLNLLLRSLNIKSININDYTAYVNSILMYQGNEFSINDNLEIISDVDGLISKINEAIEQLPNYQI